MVKSSRSSVKTLTINKSRDIVVDRLVKQCEQGNHSKCTGWAVLKKEHSPINANYFLRCNCACHKKGSKLRKQSAPAKTKTKKTRKQVNKRKPTKKNKRSRR